MKEKIDSQINLLNKLARVSEGHEINLRITAEVLRLLRKAASQYFKSKKIAPEYYHTGFGEPEILEYLEERGINVKIIDDMLEFKGIIEKQLTNSNTNLDYN